MGPGRASMLGAIRTQGLFLARTWWRWVKKYPCGETGAGYGTPHSYEPGRDLRKRDRPTRGGRYRTSRDCMVRLWHGFLTCRAGGLRRGYGGADIAVMRGKVLHPSVNSGRERLRRVHSRIGDGAAELVHIGHYPRRLAHKVARELRG